MGGEEGHIRKGGGRGEGNCLLYGLDTTHYHFHSNHYHDIYFDLRVTTKAAREVRFCKEKLSDYVTPFFIQNCKYDIYKNI